MAHAEQAAHKSVDQLMREVTAFRSFDDFRTSAERDGYVPTLSCVPLARVTGSRREWQASVNELAERLECLGFQVWRPRAYAGKQGCTEPKAPHTVLAS